MPVSRKIQRVMAGTEGAGVMQIQSTGFTTFREQDGLAADRVFSVLTDHDRAVLADTIPSTVAAHQWSGCAGFPEASPADLARTNPKACYPGH
jgi:hypothetical protein